MGQSPYSFAASLLLVILVLGYTSYISNQRLSVNPASYASLLDLIARAESSDNYNAYFGNAKNSNIDFTSMTIAEVMKWQKEYLNQGSPSDAVGRYQIISPTLIGLVDQLGIDLSQTFNEGTQDKLAMALIERRGAKDYVNNQINREEFAANLAREWAGLPRVFGDQPEKSYYAGDGLNKSNVSVKRVLEAIEPISAKWLKNSQLAIQAQARII